MSTATILATAHAIIAEAAKQGVHLHSGQDIRVWRGGDDVLRHAWHYGTRNDYLPGVYVTLYLNPADIETPQHQALAADDLAYDIEQAFADDETRRTA